jgi:hypothetical protein
MADPTVPIHGQYASGTSGPGDPTVHIPGQYPPAGSTYPAASGYGGQYSYPPGGEPDYPAPGAHPPRAGKRKRRGTKIALIVLALVLVLGGGGAAYWYLIRGVDRLFTEGSCLDTPALSTPVGTAGPSVVDCGDPAAQSRILKVFDGRTSADGAQLCGSVPGAVAHMQLTLSSGATKLLCLGEA